MALEKLQRVVFVLDLPDEPTLLFDVNPKSKFFDAHADMEIQIIRSRGHFMDFGKFEKELLSVVEWLVKQNPDMGAIVLECTDMSYFAPLIQQTVNLPVFDIVTLTNMVYQAVVRKPFGGLVDTNA